MDCLPEWRVHVFGKVEGRWSRCGGHWGSAGRSLGKVGIVRGRSGFTNIRARYIYGMGLQRIVIFHQCTRSSYVVVDFHG